MRKGSRSWDSQDLAKIFEHLGAGAVIFGASQTLLTSPAQKGKCLCWSVCFQAIGCPSLPVQRDSCKVHFSGSFAKGLLVSFRNTEAWGDEGGEKGSKVQVNPLSCLSLAPAPVLPSMASQQTCGSRSLGSRNLSSQFFSPLSLCGWEGAACCCCSSLRQLTSPLGFSALPAPPN